MKTLLCKEKLILNPPELGCALYLPGLPGSGSKIYDRSPYGNNDTITGATWTRLPGGLWCLSFDGTDDYVTCVAGGLSGNMGTVSVWVKPDFGYNVASNQVVVDIVDSINARVMELYYGHADDKWVVYDAATGGTVKSNSQSFAAGMAMHLAVTWDNTSGKKIYINGAHHDTQSATWAALTPDTVYIGIYHDLVSEPFAGVIALTKIYNRVLSALEIQNHFSREKGLFGVW